MNRIAEAAANGYANLAARADLLDRINVFPVPDGDTGTNLRISLAPLLQTDRSQDDLSALLARSATGNSGNIAAAFLQGFLCRHSRTAFADAARRGRDSAFQAVPDARRGTMLDVFEVLVCISADQPVPDANGFLFLCSRLQETVLATTTLLPALQTAGVVDSGALGMFLFLEGFLKTSSGYSGSIPSLSQRFGDRLALLPSWSGKPCAGHCINALLKTDDPSATPDRLAELGDSIVVSREKDELKIHLHSLYPDRVRDYLVHAGELLRFNDEDLAGQAHAVAKPDFADQGTLHIMTDAAGSLERKTALANNITLLDSYIIVDDQARPESLCDPADLYNRLRRGDKITTAQASISERNHHYAAAVEEYRQVLYLCVGSAYTGNYTAAKGWKNRHDPEGRLQLLDTGAASGRLALIALLTARFAAQAVQAAAVLDFAGRCCRICREYVFIDELQYLVAGGRVSRAKAFLGDLLHMKPVISPMADGVRKQGVTRSRDEQLRFALDRLRNEAAADSLILLQYSDNGQWLEQVVFPEIRDLLPEAEVLSMPLSLTSGVHMGPGTWAIAFADESCIQPHNKG